jgi:8-oxo-dGTP pyrophosphatase MutT (NUDIX family)
VWDRLNILGEVPGSTELPMAAVLAALYPDGDEIRLILTKRPMTMPTHAGHLAFPGGRPHADDLGPVETALREAHEEVGLRPEDVEVIGFLPPIHTVEFSLFVVPVVGRLGRVPDLVPSEREVDRVLTPALSELVDESRWRHEVWQGRKVWFFELEGESLWGATARMTRDLLGMET